MRPTSKALLALVAACAITSVGCGSETTSPHLKSELRRSTPIPPDGCDYDFECHMIVYLHSIAQDPYHLLDEPRRKQVNLALAHMNVSDEECASLANYVQAHFDSNRIKFYYFETLGAWAKSRLDKSADPDATDSFNEFRLASKSFNDTRQLTLTLLHEAWHLYHRMDQTEENETQAELQAHACYLP